MKKLVLLIVSIAALAVAAPAMAGTTTIVIGAKGFSPEEVVIRPGDTVTWKNMDTAEHQVVSDVGVFRSPRLAPGASYSYAFSTPSSYSYHDVVSRSSSMTGVVHVQSTKVTIGVTSIRAIYGAPVRIFGSIPNGTAGQEVTIHITPYRGQETTRTVVTDSEGTWEFSYRPTIRTVFSAEWNGAMSEKAPIVAVRPLVVFRTLNAARNRFLVRVKAARSYANKLVRIQRLNNRGVWVTTKIVKLNRFGEARFTGKFARGTTKARAWVTRSPGYTVGFSVVKTVRR